MNETAVNLREAAKKRLLELAIECGAEQSVSDEGHDLLDEITMSAASLIAFAECLQAEQERQVHTSSRCSGCIHEHQSYAEFVGCEDECNPMHSLYEAQEKA